MSEVQIELGEADFSDQWASEHRLVYQLPISSNSDPEEVGLSFAFELLQSVGPIDSADWRRYSVKAGRPAEWEPNW